MEIPVKLTSTHRRMRLAYDLRKDGAEIGNSGPLTPSQAVACMMCATLFTWVLASAVAIAGQTPTNPPAAVAAPADGKHTITVNFDYDFSKTPSCSRRTKKACIVQFNIYDISAGAKSHTKLFSIPVTPGETKPASGITGKSPPLLLEPGKHELAVTAQMSNGKESDVYATTTWVDIGPNSK
jgi:hypothetical protein